MRLGFYWGLRCGLVWDLDCGLVWCVWDGMGLGFGLSSALGLWFFPVWFGVLVFVYIGALVYFPCGLGFSLFQFIKSIIRSQRVLKYNVFATCFPHVF